MQLVTFLRKESGMWW